MSKPRDEKGRFARVHQFWDGSDWNDGYIARGRMRVYRPDYPGTIMGPGYTERAWVVWWLINGEPPSDGFVVHHKNEDKLDDRPENLELWKHGRHTTYHRTGKIWGARKQVECANCNIAFSILESEIRSRIQQGRGEMNFYCSQKCQHEGLRISPTTKICEHCKQEYETISWRAKASRFCSRSCATSYRWQEQSY